MGYDIIGDIHGQFEKLESLLTRLGYRQRQGAWSTTTATISSAPANTAIGHIRSPATRDHNAADAFLRRGKTWIDILYSGACTSRQKRYAAVPAPDMANLPLIDE